MKSKILFILHLPPPIHGAAMVGKYIHDSKLINSTFECSYINETISNEVSQVGKFGWFKITRIFSHCLEISRAIRKIRPDLVYITPSAYQPEIGMIRYLFEFSIINYWGCKKLIHFHNKGDKEKCKKIFFRFYYKMLFKNAKVIFLSHRLESQFDWILDYKDILICPNGIPNVAVPLVKEKTENKIPNILFLSNMMVEKGVWNLLEACSLMKSRGVRFRCHFVGKWSDITEEAFENKVLMYQLQDYVTAYGGKYGEEKAKYFEQADVSVLPTYNDCFPLVLLEAMQYSLPCVSTNEGGIPSVIDDGKTGFIVEKKQPNVLADKLQWLIEHPDVCTKLGKAGKQKFEREFTLEQFEKRMIDILAQEIEK